MGEALRSSLLNDGHRVVRLVRRPSRPLSDSTGEVECQWSTSDGIIDLDRARGLDAVVHLAGESLAKGRWNKERRERIRDSRVLGTHNLVSSLTRLSAAPAVLINASAVGYYGDRGDEILDETKGPGSGFLAEVCVAWEQEAAVARNHGVRVVPLRFGVILSDHGGALEKILTPFRLGLGGRIGTGEQYMSWVALSDVIRAIRFALDHTELDQPVNVCAPQPVTNAEFTAALGKALGRPTVVTVPEAAIKIALGEMAEETILVSTRCVPRRLEAAGFEFRFAHISEALGALIDT